jgi:type VI secretion system secreted protein VgrG
MAIKTPLGDDKLLLDTFSGTEALSHLFTFKLGMYAEFETANQSPVEFDKLLGKEVTVTFQGEPSRYFHGIISRLSQGQRMAGLAEGSKLIRFEAEMVPKFWLLTKNFQSRIYQQKTVPDILKDVMKDLDVSWEIQGTFEPRDYCVQYRESDFDFASRLMEEEGIYYYFKHSESAHKMVVANAAQSHVAVPGASPIKYEEIKGAGREDERINDWVKGQVIRTAKQTLRDHCFELDDNLEGEQPITETVQVGTVSHKFKTAVNAELEHYDFPGRYAQRFDGIDSGGSPQDSELQKVFDDKDRTTRIRIEEEAAQAVVIAGGGNCRLMSAGYKFTLGEHFDANGDYVITEIEHTASVEGSYAQMTREGPVYANKFHCIPSAVPYRPQRKTRKARVEGTQTAVVVGPAGDEIFTDKYGRVKVQFFWDRKGQKDASSSCWVRVATLMGGKQWGMIHIPRIGQEVIVAFEEGDADQPVIIGSVFNAQQMPPYTLPDNKTQMGFKTRSSLSGDAETFNELRFEDKKDSEEVYFHAQKDLNQVVENNFSLKVGKPGADDGSQTLEVYKDRTESVKTGNDKLTIEQGDRESKISVGKDTTEAGTSIELKVGGCSIKIEQSGITIKAPMITIQGDATVDVKSPKTTVNGDGMLTLKGGVTMIN